MSIQVIISQMDSAGGRLVSRGVERGAHIDTAAHTSTGAHLMQKTSIHDTVTFNLVVLNFHTIAYAKTCTVQLKC